MTSTVFDLAKIRTQFPALHQTVQGVTPIFLDGPGGAQVPRSVPQAMADYLLSSNSNLLNSEFFAVQQTHAVVKQARENAAIFVNALQPENIVFGQSMSALTAHFSRSISREWQAGDEIITTALDHYSNVSFWQKAAEDRGVTYHQARVNIADGTLDLDHLDRLINKRTKLIAFTLASNVTGSLTDASRIIKAAKKVGALTYVDAVHYAPHFLPDVQALDTDFLACSAYKFGGPHLGFLYGKPEHLTRLTPYKVEPAPTEPPECWEMGTKSFEALAGFNAVIEYMGSFYPDQEDLRSSLQAFYRDVFTHEQQLIRHFLEQAKALPAMQIFGITDEAGLHQRTSTFAFRIEGQTPQEVSDHLASHQIITGAGNFYAKGLIDAFGFAESGGIVRAGCLHYNTTQELDRFFELLS